MERSGLDRRGILETKPLPVHPRVHSRLGICRLIRWPTAGFYFEDNRRLRALTDVVRLKPATVEILARSSLGVEKSWISALTAFVGTFMDHTCRLSRAIAATHLLRSSLTGLLLLLRLRNCFSGEGDMRASFPVNVNLSSQTYLRALSSAV